MDGLRERMIERIMLNWIQMGRTVDCTTRRALQNLTNADLVLLLSASNELVDSSPIYYPLSGEVVCLN